MWKSAPTYSCSTPGTGALSIPGPHAVLPLHLRGLTPSSFPLLSRSSEVTAATLGWPRRAVVTLAEINVRRHDQGLFMCRAFNHFSNYNSDPGDTPHRLWTAALTCIISLPMLCMQNALRAFNLGLNLWLFLPTSRHCPRLSLPFYCSPRCLIVIQCLVGAELMTAVVGLMMPFQHLNHILNINDPFTPSRAEDDDIESFPGSFISGHTVLCPRPSPSKKQNKKDSIASVSTENNVIGRIKPGLPPYRLYWLVNKTHPLWLEPEWHELQVETAAVWPLTIWNEASQPAAIPVLAMVNWV